MLRCHQQRKPDPRPHIDTVQDWRLSPVHHVILPGPYAVTVLHRIGAARPRNKLPINVRAWRDQAVFSVADRKSMLNTAATNDTAFTSVNHSETWATNSHSPAGTDIKTSQRVHSYDIFCFY